MTGNVKGIAPTATYIPAKPNPCTKAFGKILGCNRILIGARGLDEASTNEKKKI